MEETKIHVTPARQKRVLIVEDEAMVLYAEKHMVARLGCQVDMATNGDAAVRKMKELGGSEDTRYDLILMDINMPIMNGYSASRAINDMTVKGLIFPTPIICLSAQDSLEHREKCIASGISERRILYLFHIL